VNDQLLVSTPPAAAPVAAPPPRPPAAAAAGAQAMPLQKQINQKLAGKTIEFTKNSLEMTAESKKLLDAIATLIQSQPNVKVEISGHTDRWGTAEYNLQLSQRRADAVKKYLVSRQVAADRLRTIGYGATRAIGDDVSREAQKKNRRIEFRVIE
jgi:OmpA-OmpF porin, OOP family